MFRSQCGYTPLELGFGLAAIQVLVLGRNSKAGVVFLMMRHGLCHLRGSLGFFARSKEVPDGNEQYSRQKPTDEDLYQAEEERAPVRKLQLFT
jgi:hypothetical protein